MSMLLRRPQVLERTGIKTTRLYEMIASGEFPAPVRIGNGRAVAWVSSEVDEYIAKLVAAPRVKLRTKTRSRGGHATA